MRKEQTWIDLLPSKETGETSQFIGRCMVLVRDLGCIKWKAIVITLTKTGNVDVTNGLGIRVERGQKPANLET